MKKFATTLVLMFSSLIFASLTMADNDPSLHQVYSAAQAGKLDEAQQMMDKVLHDHPNSAKAHYVEAEILVQRGQLGAASSELANAERLQPGLPFAKPEAVQALKNRIAAPYAAPSAPVHSSSFPWGMLLLGLASIVIITFIVRAMNARNSSYFPAGPQPGMQPMYGNNPYGPMSPGPMAGGGMGSSILGGLATGAAVGAGMVAGEALVHHFLDGNSSGNANGVVPAADSYAAGSSDLGGADFGINDASSWDDSSRFADSGGSDDWS